MSEPSEGSAERESEKVELQTERDAKLTSSVELFGFKWNQEVAEYGDKLLRRLEEFREKEIFYDVLLKAKDGDLPAHKVVLAACGGIFRSRFVDQQTKMIAHDVTEVRFDCPAEGLKPILKFAYSGVLELNHVNVLVALKAAIISEMKEVQEICADLAISHFGWVLAYDGTEESLKHDQALRKSFPQNAEAATDALNWLIEIYSTHSPTVADEETSLEVPDKLLESVGDHKSVYCEIVMSLMEAKTLVKPKSNEKHPSEAKNLNDSAISNDNHVTKVDAVSKVNDVTKPNDDTAVNSESATLPRDASPSPKIFPKERKSIKTKQPSPSPNEKRTSVSSTEGQTQRPHTKPRSVTSPEVVAASPKDNDKKPRPPSPPKEPPKLRPHSQSLSGASPVPTRRKNAAPKPPGTSPGGKELVRSGSVPAKGKHPPPKKIPPPRPKPPSVKVKTNKETRSLSQTTEYNDALNPFTMDDEEVGKPELQEVKNDENLNDSSNPFD